jgi:hypothetical protein
MNVPQRVPFEVYIGTVVCNLIAGKPKVLMPYVIVTINPHSHEPDEFVTSVDGFENAVIEMEDIQNEEIRHNANCYWPETPPSIYSVLRITDETGIVTWKDCLPPTKVDF